MSDPSIKDFEAAIAELEAIVKKLEEGDLALETFDLRRRLAGLRTRLVAGDARLASLRDRKRHALDARLGATVARLESLSPLAVLARGYAVCWNADRTKVIRDTSSVAIGDRVRVTVEHGELACEVTDKAGPKGSAQQG